MWFNRKIAGCDPSQLQKTRNYERNDSQTENTILATACGNDPR